MRKALMSLIMAATVMTPIAAEAQMRDRGEARSQRAESRSESRAERQSQRSEARVQRQAVRAERQSSRAERQSARQQAPAAQPVAVAQRERGNRGDRNRGDSGRRGSIYPQAWQGNPNDPARQRYERLERQNQYRYGTREQRRDIRQDRREDRRESRQDRREDRRDWRRDRRDDRRDWRQDRRADRRDWRNDWNRGWRNDRRYDWNSWRYRNRHIYRMPAYYSPYRNHRYSRFSIGFLLEPLFYSNRYWLNDPYQYRLPHAPAGTQWVRYYNDVLLVDVYSGEVVDVIYDFFW
ncbi:RcnB family protein [Sphingosinicella terrae]|uniref:RcnB family protein n=1 Tax=Sphingosinicella terrae TaxID=2172047 RepID=UPI000E0D0DC8|nr:RcnB family protein [Sphingosinicella terrae]